jgi:hypothetical protein
VIPKKHGNRAPSLHVTLHLPVCLSSFRFKFACRGVFVLEWMSLEIGRSCQRLISRAAKIHPSSSTSARQSSYILDDAIHDTGFVTELVQHGNKSTSASQQCGHSQFFIISETINTLHERNLEPRSCASSVLRIARKVRIRADGRNAPGDLSRRRSRLAGVAEEHHAVVYKSRYETCDGHILLSRFSNVQSMVIYHTKSSNVQYSLAKFGAKRARSCAGRY